jgi:hypothetical protein
MVAEAKKRHPDYNFRQQDILTNPLKAEYDIILMNGVLTVKAALKQAQMEAFAKKLIEAAFRKCRVALAFNVMSTHVDWQREDLFHWPFDAAADFLASLSKHFVFRQDYGLYEYTAYLYKDAR